MNQLTLIGHNLSNICRLCLTNGEFMTDIFCFSSKFGKHIADVLMECAPVQITKNERMPKYICQLCYNQLENVRKFQTQAVQSERTLLQYLQQIDTTDRQTPPSCSIKISSGDFINENSSADVSVKIEFVEPDERFNEDNCEEATESCHEQSDFFENVFLKTEKDCVVQIKQENTEDSPIENSNDYIISENFENQRSVEETKSFHKYQENDKKAINSVKKTYQCDICNEYFRQLGHLNDHKRTHTGERPYQCNLCSKSYTRLHNLNTHKRTHTGEKPYQCDVCNKCFNQRGHLKGHKSTHSEKMSDESNILLLLQKLSGNGIVNNYTIKNENSFTATVRAKSGHSDDKDKTFYNKWCYNWIQRFSQETSTNWIVRYTFPNIQKFKFKKVFKCQHNSFDKVKKKKRDDTRQRNKDCDASITFIFKKINRNTIRNDPLLRQELDVYIQISCDHSHEINVAEAYRYLRMTPETKEIFLKYFDDGMTPSAARGFHETKLENETDENQISVALLNAQINPTERQVQHLYCKWREEHFGGRKH